MSFGMKAFSSSLKRLAGTRHVPPGSHHRKQLKHENASREERPKQAAVMLFTMTRKHHG
jgi:hypothetical protein